jgi:hypothetical protein
MADMKNNVKNKLSDLGNHLFERMEREVRALKKRLACQERLL